MSSKPYQYDYPMMSLVVDIVVTASEGNNLLMVTRKKDPWKGCKALPGGFDDVENAEWIDQSLFLNLVSCNNIAADHSVIVGDALGWGNNNSYNPKLMYRSCLLHKREPK